MNTGRPGSFGGSKHHKAFGHQPVSRDVKLHIQRAANPPRRRRPKTAMYDTVAALMKAEREKKNG